MEEDVKEIVLEIASYILKLAGYSDNIEENKEKVISNIQNGKAYNKFLELVKIQGGDIKYLENIPKAKYVKEVKSDNSGYVTKLNAEKCGRVSLELGAGRKKTEDKIDNLVGIVLNKKIGDKVDNGDILAYIHSNEEEKIKEAEYNIKSAYEISKEKNIKYEHILGIV